MTTSTYFLSAASAVLMVDNRTVPIPWNPDDVWTHFEQHPGDLDDLLKNAHPIVFDGFLRHLLQRPHAAFPIPDDIRIKLWKRIAAAPRHEISFWVASASARFRDEIPEGANPDTLYHMGVKVSKIIAAGLRVELIQDHQACLDALRYYVSAPRDKLPKISIPATPKIPKRNMQECGVWEFKSEKDLQHWMWVSRWKAAMFKVVPYSPSSAAIYIHENYTSKEKTRWKELLELWQASSAKESPPPQNNSPTDSGSTSPSPPSSHTSPPRHSLERLG